MNPSDEVVLIRTAITDEEGLATTSFRIPLTLSSNGTWTAISTVSLADKVVWDITTFQVYLIIPVGGYSVSINVKSQKEPTAQYNCDCNPNSCLNNHKTQNHTKRTLSSRSLLALVPTFSTCIVKLCCARWINAVSPLVFCLMESACHFEDEI